VDLTVDQRIDAILLDAAQQVAKLKEEGPVMVSDVVIGFTFSTELSTLDSMTAVTSSTPWVIHAGLTELISNSVSEWDGDDGE
jgi:hypothetical protein